MRTVLITLIGPERTSDLVVDADTPVAELLPSLLAAGNATPSPSGAETWTVALTGKQPVEPERTLEQSGVLDGAVLVLRREADAPAERVTAPMPGGGRHGSPLERTRSLLHDHVSPGGRRVRFRPQLPEPGLVADGRAQALERAVATPALDRCATIAVLSPKGGVGKTTISIMLGELMGALRPDEVLALDADSDYGSLGRVAPAQQGAGVYEARDSGIFPALAEGAVTFAELDRTLWALPGGLRIVPAPRDPAEMARTDRSAYARVIGTLQRLTGVLVVDCGTGLGQPGVTTTSGDAALARAQAKTISRLRAMVAGERGRIVTLQQQLGRERALRRIQIHAKAKHNRNQHHATRRR